MTAAALVLVALLAGPAPSHEHCWHKRPASPWVKADHFCCHDGQLRSCLGHGKYKPGCGTTTPAVFPLLGKDPEELRYDYDYGK